MISMPRQFVYTEYNPVRSWIVSKPPLYLSKPFRRILSPRICRNSSKSGEFSWLSNISSSVRWSSWTYSTPTFNSDFMNTWSSFSSSSWVSGNWPNVNGGFTFTSLPKLRTTSSRLYLWEMRNSWMFVLREEWSLIEFYRHLTLSLREVKSRKRFLEYRREVALLKFRDSKRWQA